MRRFIAVALAAGLLTVSAVPASAATAWQRPISDWVEAQQAFLDPTIPVELQVISWFEPGSNENYLGDMDGRVAMWVAANGGPSLMPRLSGKITERLLADGRAEVLVNLRFDSAITYGWRDENDFIDFPEGPELFGHRASEIVAGAPATLGRGVFSIRFIHTDPGGPLPELARLVFEPQPGEELLSVSFGASAFGPLREASGWAEGTPGRASTQQVGLFVASTPDGFPVEWVHYRPVGR